LSTAGVPINSGAAGSGSEDDDIEYFRKAVGENPDKGWLGLNKFKSPISSCINE